MKVSDLMDGSKPKKGMKLNVRVPAKMVDRDPSPRQKIKRKPTGLGAEATGELVSVKMEGRAVHVTVKVGEKKHVFRPQDLTEA